MILDSSAIVAIIRREPGHDVLLDCLAGASTPGVGAPTLVEAGIVLSAGQPLLCVGDDFAHADLGLVPLRPPRDA